MVDNLEQLFKVRTIKGNYCHLKHIDTKDAYLIHDLRLERPDFIERTSPNIEVQKFYLEQYFKSFQKNMQIYYKVYDLKENTFIGVFRLTELNNDLLFNWESAVFKKKCTPNTFLDTMLMTYRIGFEFLKRKECGPWKVKKNNSRMMKLHSIIDMVKIIEEDDKYYFVSVKKEDYFFRIKKFKNLRFGQLGGLM